MATTPLDQCMDLVERQFDEVLSLLVDNSSVALEESCAGLQQAFIQLAAHCKLHRQSYGRLDGSRTKRLQSLDNRMTLVRESLLRRSAYVERALQTIMPTDDKPTYVTSGPYGNAMRQSGAFKFLAA